MLTDKGIKTLKHPEKGQKIYYDGDLPGFAIRLSQGGAKTFILIHGQDKRKITIGRYPIISLSMARDEAKRMLAEFTLGRIRPQSITYSQAVDLFVAEKLKNRRKRTADDYKKLLDRLNFKCQLTEIAPHEFSRRLDRFKAPSTRSHVLVASKVFYRWCINRRYIEHDPTLGLQKPPFVLGKRMPSDEEIRAIWKATEDCTQFNRVIRLCITTGGRRGELNLLKPEWVAKDRCTIPASVCKNNVEFTFPLSSLAISTLKDFPYRPCNNWSDDKKKLDEASNTTGWKIHQIRKFYKSTHSKIGTPPHISEMLLHHISAQSTLERTYNLHPYWDELTRAVVAYDRHLSQLLQIH